MDEIVERMLLIWSVRMAVACYLVRAAIDLRNCRVATTEGKGSRRFARIAWSFGVISLVIHVTAAFAYVHEWSHDHAIAHTAEQTAAVTGWSFGGGLYFNYAFTAFWICDVIAWWTRGIVHHAQSFRYQLLLHTAFAFMLFNATAVFGPPIWKPITACAIIVLVAIYAWPSSNKRKAERSVNQPISDKK